jgi:hypothetical protein
MKLSLIWFLEKLANLTPAEPFVQAPGSGTQGNVKVSFTLLNWIHNSRLSKNPPSPFEKGGNRKSPFVKGDLEGFSSAQHDFDETPLPIRQPLLRRTAGAKSRASSLESNESL